VVRNGAIVLAVLAGLVIGGCGGKKKAETPELKGTIAFGVLAPTEREGELGVRAKDLTDGAQLAVGDLTSESGDR